MHRVLITAGAAPLPTQLAKTLLARPDVESVVLADSRHPDPPRRAETVSLGEGYADIRDAIWDHRIDTVVHGALAPDRLGDHSTVHDANVIATMQVAAVAADLDGPVRRLFALSSTMRYPARANSPQVHEERQRPQSLPETTYGSTLAEAEDYLLALAEQRPNLSICILRLADLIGPSVRSPLAAFLGHAMPARYLGFDPMVQFLDTDDGVAAIHHAFQHDLVGTFNVASLGVIQWSRAIRLSGGVALPLLPPTLDPFTGARRLLRADPVPKGLSHTLRFGRVASTERLETTGFVAATTVEASVRALGARRRAMLLPPRPPSRSP